MYYRMDMVVQSNPRKIIRHGNSDAVTIPPAILEEMDLEQGDQVVIEADGREATVRPVEWSVA